MDEWTPIKDLPTPGKRFGRYWVIVHGEEYHSGGTWVRRSAGLARTYNDGFNREDVAIIAAEDHMDLGSAVVTHFLPITLPPFPII